MSETQDERLAPQLTGAGVRRMIASGESANPDLRDTPTAMLLRELAGALERAEAAERELAILRGHCRSIAARWEDRGTPRGHRRDEIWEWQEQVKRCAAELLAALDAGRQP